MNVAPPTSDVIERENAEHYSWGDICEGWHLLKADALSVIEERIPPGGSEVRHIINAPDSSSMFSRAFCPSRLTAANLT